MQDLTNIYFQKSKNNFKIFKKSGDKLEKIRLISPTVLIPFGIEKYKNKEIINIEFTDLHKSNEMYNFYTNIKQLDNYINKLSYDNELKKKLNNNYFNNEIINCVNNKTYISCIKERPNNFNPLLRVHIKKNKIISTNNIPLDTTKIKNKLCIVDIEVDSLWFTSTGYGLVILCDSIKLIS